MNCIMRFAKVAVCGVLLGGVFLGSAQATGLVQIDNPSVNFILEYDDAVLGLYGVPSISITGNIEYTPPNFRAASGFGFCSTPFTGAPNCNVQSELNLTLIARTGFAFDGITLNEGGSYKLNGASAVVSVAGVMDVFEGGTISGQNEFGSIISGTTFVDDNIFHPWSAAASANLTGLNWDGITTIDIVVDNSLVAFSAPSSTDEAEIQKEQVATGVSLGIDMSGGASNVPVPAAVWLFASGLLGLGGLARRKGRQSA